MAYLHKIDGIVNSIAVWLSRVFHPFLISVVVLFGVQRLSGYSFLESAAWTALSFAIVILPTLTFILIRISTGRYVDLDVSVRHDRHLLYGLGGLCFILLVVLLALLHAPAIVQRTLHAGLLAIAAGATFNRFVNKLSLHTLTVAGCATVLFFVAPLAGIGLGLISILVAWSRLYLARHTLLEVFWGWVIGVVSVVLWFSLSLI